MRHIPLDQLDALPLAYRVTISEQHLDRNEHVNVRWYLAFFNEAFLGLAASLGLSEEHFAATRTGIMALRHDITYLAEVRLGQTLAIRIRVIGRSAKRWHTLVLMFNETTGALAAMLEALGTHADLQTRRSAPWPPHAAAAMDALLAEHHQLGWEPPLSGVINL